MTSMHDQRPAWQLPRGVCSGTWDYLVEPTIASEYDSFHGPHPLMKLDTELLLESLQGRIPDQTIVADFGCGTGRIARTLEPLGFRILSVDLSTHMLRTAHQALRLQTLNSCVHSNLVELQWLCDGVLDFAVCLFSSLGMIQGRKHRVEFLQHVCRALKADGKLLVHVHNRGRSWLDPQGPRWLLAGWLRSLRGRQSEMGDRVYNYRGLPRMFLHIYSQAELRRDLMAAGFSKVDIRAIDVTGSRLLSKHTWGTYLRAGGFFAWASR